MKIWFWVWLACSVALGGCTSSRRTNGIAQTRGASPGGSVAPGSTNVAIKLVVSPDETVIGRVVMVNSRARFAVLNFPIGVMPATGQRLSVYRHGVKVGEVRLSGPQLDDNIVADIAVGDAQSGDEARGD